MWAHGGLPTDCHPDVITSAKALGNGYPIGAVMLREELGRVMGYGACVRFGGKGTDVKFVLIIGTHGTTFGGSAMACSIGEYVVGRLEELQGNVKEMGAYLGSKLEELQREYPDTILGVRGRGLIRGIIVAEPGRIVSRSRERGVLLLSAGSDAVRLLPSLMVTRDDIDVAITAIANSIRP